ncbi:hypothetical protein ACOBQX_05030 [Actinokineospora sp. G85]
MTSHDRHATDLRHRVADRPSRNADSTSTANPSAAGQASRALEMRAA